MFNDYGKPFYQSTEFLYLQKIDKNIYADFVKKHFNLNKKSIKTEQINAILDYYDMHTFYVQFFFNKLYSNVNEQITEQIIEEIKQMIINEKEYIYYNYRNLLTPFQFKLLKAIAKEKVISKPNSKEFIWKHKLNQASSVNRAIKSLIDKEMICEENGNYKVYDMFFSKWLDKL